MNIQEIISRNEYQPIDATEMAFVVQEYIRQTKGVGISIAKGSLIHPFEVSKLASAFEYAALHFSQNP